MEAIEWINNTVKYLEGGYIQITVVENDERGYEDKYFTEVTLLGDKLQYLDNLIVSEDWEQTLHQATVEATKLHIKLTKTKKLNLPEGVQMVKEVRYGL